jgi:hypothetical protein
MPTKPSAFFPANYAAGRARFRDAAQAAGGRLGTHANPAPGPDGIALSTETAWFGPEDAGKLLIGMSGTHGVEGFCGSGIQSGWLETGKLKKLPADTAVLLIHAINPSGFAWVRRVNEGNIDLNRNFVDHAKSYPDNPGYRELRDVICPTEWSEEGEARNKRRMAAYRDRHGALALQAAIMQGQYVDDEGVFYGGTAPSWSNQTLRAILEPHADHVRDVAFIDLHTGLGPYGYGEIISNHLADDPGNARVKEWMGSEATDTNVEGSSTSTLVTGDTNIGVAQSLPQANVTGITLEYGTVPLEDMLESVRADNWVHIHGDLGNAKGRAIKAQIRDAFYCDKDDWKDMVFERAVDVYDRMMAGLTQS